MTGCPPLYHFVPPPLALFTNLCTHDETKCLSHHPSIEARGSKRPLKVYKSDVPEENLTFGLFLRSWKVEESKDRNPSFHLLYKRPRLVIVETNAGSRKFGEDNEAFVCAPACTICGSIVTRQYAFTVCVVCE